MRTFLFILCAASLALPSFSAPASEEPEIVIELTGEPDDVPKGVSWWNKNAKELEDFFAKEEKKTKKKIKREDVLRLIDSVSSYDRALTSADKKKYRYVRYGSDDGDYRKFLFDKQDNLLACADNLLQVLALNQQYNINMGVAESDFLRTFPEAILMNLIDFSNSRELQSYQITLPKQEKPSYFIFNNERLEQSFFNEETYAQYTTDLSAKNQKWLEREHEKQQKQLEQLRREREEAIRKEREERYRWKALVEGGTIEDQLYLPRVNDPEKYKLPPLVPSTTPAGMPIIVH